MANEEQVALLKQGTKVWNQWREENPDAEIDLSDANLNSADLFSADLSYADLSRANLCNAQLWYAQLNDVDLSDADLRGANLTYSTLYAALFRNTDLRNANLAFSLVLDAGFEGSRLTGACIESWQTSYTTDFENIRCDYVFRHWNIKTDAFEQRLPVNPDSIFAPNEFERWIKVRASALNTIDITFLDGIDWQAFFQSLEMVRQRHPDAGIRMQSVQEQDGTYVAALKLETEIDGEALNQLKAQIETETKTFYERQLIEARAENRVLERSLDKAMEKLAMASSNNTQNFHGPVGNVSGNNYGTMTAYINQNNESISQLITALRATAQSFPSEQKEEILMELDDLEGDLSKPEKQEPKRLGRRLQRLIATGTAAATLAGGAATFSGNVNEFTQNVLELGEMVGLSKEDVQGKQSNP